MIDVNFESLFTVEILHKYYSDNVCPDFSVTTSADTAGIINGHKATVKQYLNTLYTGIRSSNKLPFIPVESGMKMTFYLWLNNPLFFNYTNLSANIFAGNIYYFCNRYNNAVVGGMNYLSAKIAAYNTANAYQPGDLADDGTGLIFRAIQSSGNANQHNLTDPAYWAKVDQSQYTSANDSVQWLPSVSVYNFTALQPAASISVSGYNIAANDYSLPALNKTIHFSNPVPSFNLDLTSLAPGKYNLNINGAQQYIYLNDELAPNKPFAVIELFNEPVPANANLVDGTGKLLSPTYSINFLNRATIWHYILANSPTGTITDTGSIYNFAGPANTISSTTPIPLSNSLLNFVLNINGQNHPLPCASPQRLTSVQQSGDTYACSEIYLNY